jgi:hypothetical protein
MSNIRTDMPVLARHEGAWEGEYLHMDTNGNILDRHRSQVTCQFPTSGAAAYSQINVYTWPDGRREELHFPATYRDRRIWWDTERIRGHAWEIDNRTVVLTWTRKDLPDYYLYEMIQISADGTQRGRTWHWFESDILVKRTCIKERRVR